MFNVRQVQLPGPLRSSGTVYCFAAEEGGTT
jgi:hypothetical protein